MYRTVNTVIVSFQTVSTCIVDVAGAVVCHYPLHSHEHGCFMSVRVPMNMMCNEFVSCVAHTHARTHPDTHPDTNTHTHTEFTMNFIKDTVGPPNSDWHMQSLGFSGFSVVKAAASCRNVWYFEENLWLVISAREP